MSILGVVCEYNPFHNGHEYHLMMSKSALGGDVPVVCVMSGDFVQRGEPALYSKFARAEAACLCGADLVVELPAPWALSSAEGFARGAVSLLSKLGATHLSFGSEAGELEPLRQIADALSGEGVINEIKETMYRDASLPFAAAREKVLVKTLGELGQQIELPNNILAVEYLKAIRTVAPDMQPLTVQRYGSGHDAESEPGPKSASELRRLIIAESDVGEYMPEQAAAVFRREREQGRELSKRELFETALISRLRLFGEDYYNSLPDASDGLGARLYSAVHSEAGYDAILAAAKTKRYAMARIRRACMCAALGVSAELSAGEPGYARVLAANARGCELLKSAKESLPVLSRPAAVKSMPEDCRGLFALGASAHDLYVLGYKAQAERKPGEDWRRSPKIV